MPNQQSKIGFSLNHFIAVFFLVLIAASARLVGIDFGLPGVIARPDEERIIKIGLQFFSNDFDPHFYQKPTFHIYILHFIFRLAHWISGLPTSIPLNGPALPSTASAFLPMEKYFLMGRYLSCALGILSVPSLYLIVSRNYNKLTGLLSALFLSLCYLHARDSHFGKMDVPVTFWLVLLYGTALSMLRGREIRRYLTAGILTAFAVTTKHPGIAGTFLVLFAHFTGRGESTAAVSQGPFKKNIVSPLSVYFITTALAAFFCSPFLILNIKSFYNDLFVKQLADFGVVSYAGGGRAWWFHLSHSLFYGMGWPLYFLCLAGMGFLLLRRGPKDIVTVVYPIVYFCAAGFGRAKFERYMIPALPFLCVAGSIFLERTIRKIQEGGNARAIAFSLGSIMCFLYLPIQYIYFFDRMAMETDSRVLASRWVRKNIPTDAPLNVITAEGKYDVPYDLQDYEKNWVLGRGQRKAQSPSNLFDAGGDFFVVFHHHYFSGYTESHLVVPVLDGYLKEKCAEVFSVMPYIPGLPSDKAPVYNIHDVFYIPFTPSRHVKIPGPSISIYECKGVPGRATK